MSETNTATEAEAPTPLEAASALAFADADVFLAAERLHIPPADLLPIIATDPNAEAAYIKGIKLRATTQVYARLTQAQDLIGERLANGIITTEDLIDATKTLATLFGTLTQAAPQVTNNTTLTIMERVLQVVPADVREAIKTLVETDEEFVAQKQTEALQLLPANPLPATAPALSPVHRTKRQQRMAILDEDS